MSITINADDLRTIRALEIAARADEWTATKTPDGEPAFLIPSQSDPERRYLVTATSCECADFQRRLQLTAAGEEAAEPRACKHILAVRLYNELVRAQRNLSRPPSRRHSAH